MNTIQKHKKIPCVYRLILVLDEGTVTVERGKAILGNFSIFDVEIIDKITRAVSDNLQKQLEVMGLPLKSTVNRS